jgi:uncharacterized membrane protein
LLIDIFFTVSTLLIIWLGWSTGLARTFFAVFAGFIAIFAANKYPYQEGMNAYLIFSIAAVFVLMVGTFTVRVIKFFYLNILDRIGGAFLSVCVWFVIFTNVLIPTMTSGTNLNKSNSYAYTVISQTVHSKAPIFKDYIPLFLVKHQK